MTFWIIGFIMGMAWGSYWSYKDSLIAGAQLYAEERRRLDEEQRAKQMVREALR